ncbi:flagellin [Agrobacterium rhizogenes]|nr:flagellin [Rhizobium rhizogenes]
MTANIIDGAAMLGAVQSRIDLQSEFASRLSNSIDRGIGRLVDADMDEASTRLKALQAQQQLVVSALQIANTEPQAIVSLFR